MFQEVAGLRLPSGVPLYVTEYNFSAGVSEVPQDLMGAIWQAEFLSEFLARGGKEGYYYQYLPLQLCNSGSVWGATALITADDNDQARYMSAQFFSSEILGRDFFDFVDASHTVFPASSSIKDSLGNVLVRPCALLRPDGEYAVLLINVSASVHYVRVHFSGSKIHEFLSPVSEFGFGSSNYAWHADGPNGYAHPDSPPAETSVLGGSSLYTVPRSVDCGFAWEDFSITRSALPPQPSGLIPA